MQIIEKTFDMFSWWTVFHYPTTYKSYNNKIGKLENFVIHYHALYFDLITSIAYEH
jgi:hypothetical protein